MLMLSRYNASFLPETSLCCTPVPHFLQSSVLPIYLKLTSGAQRTKTAVGFAFVVLFVVLFPFLFHLCMYCFVSP